MSLKYLCTDTTTIAPLGDSLDKAGAPMDWRASLGERAGVRSDLPNCKTLRGWANRANRASVPLFYSPTDSDIIAEKDPNYNNLNAGLTESIFARTSYTAGKQYNDVVDSKVITRKIDRQVSYTNIDITSKESMICPTCQSGFLHPKTFMCNSGRSTPQKCGLHHPEGGEPTMRNDVANRYEPKAKVWHTTIINGKIVNTKLVTVTRRAGSDINQVNPEKWSTFLRREKGAKPTWMQQVFYTVIINDTISVRCIDISEMADLITFGVVIIGRGVNLGIREVTE